MTDFQVVCTQSDRTLTHMTPNCMTGTKEYQCQYNYLKAMHSNAQNSRQHSPGKWSYDRAVNSVVSYGFLSLQTTAIWVFKKS